MDDIQNMLTRVCESDDFFGTVVLADQSDDWKLVRQLGEFLTSIAPEDHFGYLLVARACRHLGEQDARFAALKRMGNIVESGAYIAAVELAESRKEIELGELSRGR